MAVVTVPAARAGSSPDTKMWNVAVFEISAGRISSYQGAQTPLGMSLGDARAAAAAACGARLPDAPRSLNKGGLLPLETRLTAVFSAILLAVVALVLIALAVYAGQRLRARF
jgi:hypothetical protein